MIRLGLTGGIASGKTTIRQQFATSGAHCYDADIAVHRLLHRRGPVRSAVESLFPEAMGEAGIDRRRLGAIVFDDPAALRELEAILHPAVAAEEEKEAERLARCGVRVMLSEIPLLYEVGAEGRYDATYVVSCPAFLQKHRAFRRPGMTEAKYRHILLRQMPLAEKRRHADGEIFTGLGRAVSMATVKRILADHAA